MCVYICVERVRTGARASVGCYLSFRVQFSLHVGDISAKEAVAIVVISVKQVLLLVVCGGHGGGMGVVIGWSLNNYYYLFSWATLSEYAQIAGANFSYSSIKKNIIIILQRILFFSYFNQLKYV